MTLAQLTERMGLVADRPRRILVVEDSLVFAAKLVEFLQEFGHEVVALAGIETVENGKAEALALDLESRMEVALHGFDAAFLDCYFVSRRLDGVGLTEELCRIGCGPILAMSSDRSANHRMMKSGATASLLKNDLATMLGN